VHSRRLVADVTEKKPQAIKEMGVEKVSSIAEYGVAADEIIALEKNRRTI
jgi:hypothetical protein